MNNSINETGLMSTLKKKVIIVLSIIFSLIVFGISDSYVAFYERLINLNAPIPLLTKIAYEISPCFSYVAFLLIVPAIALIALGRLSNERRAQVSKVIPIYFYISISIAVTIILSMFMPIFYMD